MASFNILHQIDSIQVPKEFYNTGIILEPITSSYPQFGSGGASQVITTKAIENFNLRNLNGGK